MLTIDNIMTDGSLAARIQWILDNRGFENPTDLANRAGVAPNYVGLLLRGERGKRGLREETAHKLASAGRVRVEWLMLGSGPPTEKESATPQAEVPPVANKYPRREQAIAGLKHVKIHPGAIAMLRFEEPGHDLELREWVERLHELDRLMLEAGAEALTRREPKS